MGIIFSVHSMGSTRTPATVRDQWTWGPVAAVPASCPMSPKSSPRFTFRPTLTALDSMCEDACVCV